MKQAGIYIHIPFCLSRCSYCDFATGMYEKGRAQAYVRALVNEIAAWREVEESGDVDTIYFGGGTPSLLTPLQIDLILQAVYERFRVLPGAEVTMEMNPGSRGVWQTNIRYRDAKNAEVKQKSGENTELSLQKLREFRHLGINRASFGAQTFDDHELKQLGRTHDSQDIRTTFRHLGEAGFENINFDLIAALPAQTLAAWQRNLDEALKLRPAHLSLYLLDVHEGTPLADQIRRGMRPTPDDDLAAEMYRLMVGRAGEAGYEHYEISNFCLPGFEARHNTKYWTGTPYYGFGCSAHSHDGARRRWANERESARYVGLIEAGKSPVVERTDLSEDDARSESIFLGLRLMRGLDLEKYRSRFGSDLRDQYDSDLARLRDAGLIEIDDRLMRLTTRGALLSNEVMAAFV